MTINEARLDQRLKDYQKPEDLLGENRLLKQLTTALLERAMQAALTHHLGYDKHDHSGNSRNGKSTKTLKGDFGSWQSRPLDAVYPILYLDALVVKVRESSHLQNQAIHLIVGINTAGRKEGLGLWVTPNEGAKFWLSVLTDLKNRGVKDIFIACVDGLTGFPEAIEVAFPKAEVQLCMVHQVRNRLKDVSWKWRKEVAEDLKLISTAASAEEGELQLAGFARKWHEPLATISRSWRQNWERRMACLSDPQEIRRVIYTTKGIESVNRSRRKVLKNRGSLPNEEAVIKLVDLALRNLSAKWNLPMRDWAVAMNRFAIMFEGRMPLD